MADNLAVTPGSGAVVALDEVGGVLHQRVKVGFGVDGAYSDVSNVAPLPTVDNNTQAILSAIGILNDTMLTVLVAVLEKMPRVTGNDQAAVSVENTITTAFSANQDIRNITGSLSNLNALGTKYVSGDNSNLAGLGHVYNNIIVS